MSAKQGKAASLFCIVRLLCYDTAYTYFCSMKGEIMQNNPPSGPNDPTYTPQPYPPYPGQPLYPPGPPPKKRRTWLWIVLGVFALAILGCVGILAASQGATSTPPGASQAPAGNTPSTGNTPAPTQAPAGNAIGKPVVVNADWTVTLNSVKKSTGSEFDMPKAGDIFLVVNVTMQNTSGSTQNASTLAQWSIRDASGQTYTQDITYGSGPDGTVAANGKIRGNIAYEVPKSVHSFTLQFVADIGSTDLAEWTVHI